MRQAVVAGDMETGKAVCKGKRQSGQVREAVKSEQAGVREADAGEVTWLTGKVCWEAGGRAGREMGRQESAARAGRRQEQEEQDRQQAGQARSKAGKE